LNDSKQKVTIDWEHIEYRFIKPDEIQDYDTVPRLEQSLSRILVGPETEIALSILKNDHHSGAGTLAIIALEQLLNIVQGEDLKSVDNTVEFWRELRMIAWHLAKNGRPSMGTAIEAAFLKMVSKVEAELQRSTTVDAIELSAFKAIVEKSIKATIDARHQSVRILGKFFSQRIISSSLLERERHINELGSQTTTIATLSSSSTITQGFKDLIQDSAENNLNFKVCVLESRPMFEGVGFVTSLLDSLDQEQTSNPTSLHRSDRVQFEVFSDASVAMVVGKANFLVIGADRVSPSGDVSNKIGSFAAAALAKTLNPNCKVVAVFETDKIASAGDELEHQKVEYNDPAEITQAWPNEYVARLQEKKEMGWQVEVKNAYFEWVPKEYIDVYVTEEGVLGAEKIARLSREKGELEQKAFGDL
jgi:translation initiation factor 2B subunit (eIF-2B alpha/beta/delta family)